MDSTPTSVAGSPKPPVVNPSPRARFQSVNGNVTAHRSMLELPALDRSIDAALLEYAAKLSMQAVTGNDAMASGFRLQGAMEFVQFFKLLGEPAPMLPSRPDLDNLPRLTDPKRQ